MRKIFLIFILFIIPIFSAFAGEQEKFQEYMRTILETGGKVKNVADTLKPNSRLYIYKQLPSMKQTLSESRQVIDDIKLKAQMEISNEMLEIVLQDSASLQLLAINVAEELLSVYEEYGNITEKAYKNVVSKYEKEAKRLQKSLEKYKKM